jgi:MFS family permease
LSITPAKATLLLCLLNGAQVIGQVVLGWVSDWVNVFVLLIVSTLAPALLSGILWYLANSFSHLLVFTLLYGLFAGGYSVLWPRFITCLTEDSATSLWLYGLLAFQRGLGNIVAGPISVELLKMATTPTNTNQSAAYRGVILFVAISLVISSFGSLGWLSQMRGRKKFSVTETPS